MFTKYGYEFETNHYVSSGGVQDTEFGYAGNDYWVGSPGTDIFFGGDGFELRLRSLRLAPRYVDALVGTDALEHVAHDAASARVMRTRPSSAAAATWICEISRLPVAP